MTVYTVENERLESEKMYRFYTEPMYGHGEWVKACCHYKLRKGREKTCLLGYYETEQDARLKIREFMNSLLNHSLDFHF